MNTTLTKRRWFWPWQDDKEETWLEEMSAGGWHLQSVGLPWTYTFAQGTARPYIYRLDYMYMDKKKLAEYLQIFQDAGWEYLGEMSNWRYWRKPADASGPVEIFTDNESKIKKYQRALLFLGFLLLILILLAMNLFNGGRAMEGLSSVVDAIYLFIMLMYAILIPTYIVVVVKLLIRIRQLRRIAL
jgi:hypothetical protein